MFRNEKPINTVPLQLRAESIHSRQIYNTTLLWCSILCYSVQQPSKINCTSDHIIAYYYSHSISIFLNFAHLDNISKATDRCD